MLTKKEWTEATFRAMSLEQRGWFGECLWANVFACSPALHYTPLCRIEDGGAPLARGGEDSVILPDFDLVSRGFRAYVDSKYKNSAVRYRHANQLRHGIDRTNYLHYEAFSDLGRRHCFLAVFEAFKEPDDLTWSGALLLRSLAALGKAVNGMSNQEHMVYWPRAQFRCLGNLTPTQAGAARHDKDAVPPDVVDGLLRLLEEECDLPRQGGLF